MEAHTSIMNTRPGGHEGRKGFTMENIKIHINYLDVYAKQLSQLTNELLGMQDKYDVTAVCPSRFRGQ